MPTPFLSPGGPGRLFVLVLPLLAVAGLATACGGGGTKAASVPTTTTPPSSASSRAAARARLTSCLEAHGVPASEANLGFGFRRSSGSGTSSTSTPPTTTATFAAAFQACRADLPAGPGQGGFQFQNSTAGRAYLQCLELHGVTVPSTPPTTGGATGANPGGGFAGLANNPNYQAARTACAALAPTRTGGSDSTSSTSSPAA